MGKLHYDSLERRMFRGVAVVHLTYDAQHGHG
jgi:hypothetical protein